MSKLMKLIRDEGGATAVEYSLMAVAIAAAIVGTVYILGGHVSTNFETYNTALSAH
jgi:Flp pilus assembly pilin Flp